MSLEIANNPIQTTETALKKASHAPESFPYRLLTRATHTLWSVSVPTMRQAGSLVFGMGQPHFRPQAKIEKTCSMKASTTGWGHHMEPRHVAHVAIAKTSRSKRLYLCYKRVYSLCVQVRHGDKSKILIQTAPIMYIHIQRHTSRMQNMYNCINHIHK